MTTDFDKRLLLALNYDSDTVPREVLDVLGKLTDEDKEILTRNAFTKPKYGYIKKDKNMKVNTLALKDEYSYLYDDFFYTVPVTHGIMNKTIHFDVPKTNNGSSLNRCEFVMIRLHEINIRITCDLLKNTFKFSSTTFNKLKVLKNELNSQLDRWNEEVKQDYARHGLKEVNGKIMCLEQKDPVDYLVSWSAPNTPQSGVGLQK